MSQPTATTLVLSVGSTPEPGVASIKHHQPAHIVLFASQESNKKTIPDIVAAIGDLAKVAQVVLLEPQAEYGFFSAYTSAFKAIEAALAFDGSIKVDITGGTKPMTAALALAASDHDVEFSYVDGERDPNTGRVISGSERVRDHMVNPLRVFRVRELERLVSSWNDSRFIDARATMAALLARSDLKRFERTLFESLSGIASAFEYWDSFDHKRSVLALDRVLPRFGDLVSDRFSQLEGFYEVLQARLKRVRPLANDSSNESEGLLEDILDNAFRRAEEGRFEDGLARLIRALEMKMHLELRQRGIKSDSQRGVGELLQKFSTALPEHRISTFFAEKKFKPFVLARNYSLIGHGVEPVVEGHFRDLAAQLNELEIRKHHDWHWPTLPSLLHEARQ